MVLPFFYVANLVTIFRNQGTHENANVEDYFLLLKKAPSMESNQHIVDAVTNRARQGQAK